MCTNAKLRGSRDTVLNASVNPSKESDFGNIKTRHLLSSSIQFNTQTTQQCQRLSTPRGKEKRLKVSLKLYDIFDDYEEEDTDDESLDTMIISNTAKTSQGDNRTADISCNLSTSRRVTYSCVKKDKADHLPDHLKSLLTAFSLTHHGISRLS
jgi:hypothetical protein